MEKSASNIDVLSSTPFHALIAAAGSGTRLGAEVPKQYIEIAGKTILRWTVEAFLACPGLQGLRVVIDPAHEALYRAAVAGLDLPPPVQGGADRRQSVFNGLNSFSHLSDKDVLLIQDAARPFSTAALIAAVSAAAREGGAATAALPVADTLRRHDDGSYVDRSGLWAVQTPQGFYYGLIRRAHAQGMAVTDDTALVSALGHEVRLVESSRDNFKITGADDLAAARRFIEGTGSMMTIRTGLGFDVHAFDREAGKDCVRLCGIDVPHPYGLAGHSDADVGLHALTDALLGAIADGDIGHHFPPSDPQWRGADSSLFLAKAMALVRARGGVVTNVDVTLICEAPKVGPHRPAMQVRIAEICGLSPGQVGVKATTTEGLGFTGRGEGIAAQAVATVRMPACF